MTSRDRGGEDLSGSLFEESDLGAKAQPWQSSLSGKIIRAGIRVGAKRWNGSNIIFIDDDAPGEQKKSDPQVAHV